MDRFVRNFIAMSIVYLGVSSIIGILMFINQMYLGPMRFVHSHLMLLGWVSMMIYGVGYHILPRFAGRVITKKSLAETQFWMANIGLIGMVTSYPLMQYNAGQGIYKYIAVLAGMLETASVFIFFYLMMTTVFKKEEEAR